MQKIWKYLIGCLLVIALLFVVSIIWVETAARYADRPNAQRIAARWYTDNVWWHPTNKDFAKTLLLKAAATGDAKAQFSLALDYEDEKQFEKAIFWYKKMADQGWSAAQRNLGMMYLGRKGAPINYELAIIWLNKAAEHGEVDAQLALGLIYLGETSQIPANLPLAIKWLQTASNLGSAKGMDAMARLYASGTGVTKNLNLASEWAARSKNLGYERADETLNLIQKLNKTEK